MLLIHIFISWTCLLFTYLEEVFGKVRKDGIQYKVMKMAMILTAMVVVVDKIFNVIVRPDVFNIL